MDIIFIKQSAEVIQVYVFFKWPALDPTWQVMRAGTYSLLSGHINNVIFSVIFKMPRKEIIPKFCSFKINFTQK